jgi:hypothetical protein
MLSIGSGYRSSVHGWDWQARPYSAGERLLHGGAEHPGRELGGAEVELLALGLLARGSAQDQVEDPLAALLHRLLAIGDGAAVDVHVLLHAAKHRAVGSRP